MIRTLLQFGLLLILCTCTDSAEQKNGAIRQETKMAIWANSPSGEYAVNTLWKRVGGGLEFTDELIRVISYAENQYDIVDTLPGKLDGVGFCGDSIVYWIQFDSESSRVVYVYCSPLVDAVC